MGYNKSIMKKKILLFATVFCVLDQIVKLVVNKFLVMEKSIIVCDRFFYLTKVYNDGISFNLFTGQKILIILFSIVIMIGLYCYSSKFLQNKRNILAFSLVLGGLVGNLIDRIVYGYVIDFLDFFIFNYNFPVFNVADACIFMGIMLLLYAIFKGEDDENSSRAE